MYIPVLRNRQVEMDVLSSLIEIRLPNIFIPMIEIIQERARSNSCRDYVEDLKELFEGHTGCFFLTYPRPKKIRASFKGPIKEFLSKTTNDEFIFQEFSRCKEIQKLIPVISYQEKSLFLDLEKINIDILRLREMGYSSIGVRLSPDQIDSIGELDSIEIGPNDYFFFDIDHKSYAEPTYQKYYMEITAAYEARNFKKIIIHCNRPNDLSNIQLANRMPIREINNQLLFDYSNADYKFDGFGDYAGLSNDIPTSGGTTSPAAVYYYTNENVFIGFRKENGPRRMEDYSQFLVPEIINSDFWQAYDANHHEKCPGCKKIVKFSLEPNKAKNPGAWKGITMLHYIFSLKELLS